MKLSVIVTTHDKQWLIGTVVDAILKYTVTPFELVMVYDGCKDKSRETVEKVLRGAGTRIGENKMVKYIPVETPDVHEVKANNAGMKASSGEYYLLLQDDMVPNERGWDIRMMRPMEVWEDIFAISGRNAYNVYPGIQVIGDLIGRVEDDTPRGTYDINTRCLVRLRDTINRGPLCMRASSVKKLNYLDEAFAPSDCDDVDICYRARLEYGWRCGVYPVDYLSDLSWGTARIKAGLNALGVESEKSKAYKDDFNQRVYKNWCLITKKYGHTFGTPKKNEDRLLEVVI